MMKNVMVIRLKYFAISKNTMLFYSELFCKSCFRYSSLRSKNIKHFLDYNR